MIRAFSVVFFCSALACFAQNENLNLARLLIAQRHLEQASELLEQAAIIHPKSVELLSLQAEIAFKLNQLERAKELLVRCTTLSPRDPAVWKRLGDLFLKRKDKQAIESFERAAQLAPFDAQAWAGVAAAQSDADMIAPAQKSFKRAIALNQAAKRRNSVVYLLYADFLRDGGRYEESVVEYQCALASDSGSAAAHLGRAKSLIQLRQWARAEEDLQFVLKDAETRIEAFNLLLRADRAQGKQREAAECAKTIEKLSTERMQQNARGSRIAADLQSAASLLKAKQFQSAAEAYEQVVKEHPEAAVAYQGIARAFGETRQWSAAESAIRHFLASEAGSASGHVLLGQILLAQKRPEDADAAFSEAFSLDPLRADAQIGLAASAILLQHYDQAIRTLRRAVASPAAGPEAHLMLTEALYKNHEPEEALRETDLLLKKDPQNEIALRMRSVLIAASQNK